MYSFFVLGLIPGTNLQITFQVWLDSLLLLIEVASIVWLYRYHREDFAKHIPPSLLHLCRFYCEKCLTAVAHLKTVALTQLSELGESNY